MRILIIFCLTFFGLLTNPVLAQFVDPQVAGGPTPVIKLNPEFPQPNEEVTVSIISGVNVVHGSEILWVLDGQEIPDSKNKREIEVKVGRAGESQTLTVVLTKPNGTRTSVSKTVTPLYLDLIIEPQTHVPEFYQGRPLPSFNSMVNVTAILSGGKIIDPDLTYVWGVDGKIVGKGSLRGQNKVSFAVPMGNLPVLSLEITDLRGNKIAKRAILFTSVNPDLLFYEANSLFGLSLMPIKKSLQLIGNSTLVRAEPYNLDSRVYNEPDVLEWKINSQLYPDSGRNPYEVTLTKTGFTGRTNLDFHVRDTTTLLQGAKGSVYINI